MSASDSFNLGRDTTLDIVGPDGPLRFNILTSFDAKPRYIDLESRAINGVIYLENIPNGHDLSFSIDRANQAIDDFLCADEAAFYAGIQRSKVTITQTIRELNGGISQYRYEGVKLKVTDRGVWSGDKKVEVRLSATAARLRKVA